MNEAVKEGKGQIPPGRLTLTARVTPRDFNGFQKRRTRVTPPLSFPLLEQGGRGGLCAFASHCRQRESNRQALFSYMKRSALAEEPKPDCARALSPGQPTGNNLPSARGVCACATLAGGAHARVPVARLLLRNNRSGLRSGAAGSWPLEGAVGPHFSRSLRNSGRVSAVPALRNRPLGESQIRDPGPDPDSGLRSRPKLPTLARSKPGGGQTGNSPPFLRRSTP